MSYDPNGDDFALSDEMSAEDDFIGEDGDDTEAEVLEEREHERAHAHAHPHIHPESLRATPESIQAIAAARARYAPKRNLIVRPMSAALIRKHPDTVSIVITKTDGRQIALVRKR